MGTIPKVYTLSYTTENISMLENDGYKKSIVCKPYCGVNSVIRYNPLRMVYWYTSKVVAHINDCNFTRQNIGTLFIL